MFEGLTSEKKIISWSTWF